MTGSVSVLFIKENTAHFGPLIGSPQGSGSLVLWVPNPQYNTLCLKRYPSKRAAQTWKKNIRNKNDTSVKLNVKFSICEELLFCYRQLKTSALCCEGVDLPPCCSDTGHGEYMLTPRDVTASSPHPGWHVWFLSIRTVKDPRRECSSRSVVHLWPFTPASGQGQYLQVGGRRVQERRRGAWLNLNILETWAYCWWETNRLFFTASEREGSGGRARTHQLHFTNWTARWGTQRHVL